MHHLSHKELTQDDLDMYYYYRKHGIKGAFFNRYFEKLKVTRTAVEAFTVTNEEYFELFSEYKYSSIRSFRLALNNYLRK